MLATIPSPISTPRTCSGAVGGSTPSVQYGYDAGVSSSNEIRPTTLTYPNGRVVTYNYAFDINMFLNRISSIADPSATLDQFNRIIKQDVVKGDLPY